MGETAVQADPAPVVVGDEDLGYLSFLNVVTN